LILCASLSHCRVIYNTSHMFNSNIDIMCVIVSLSCIIQHFPHVFVPWTSITPNWSKSKNSVKQKISKSGFKVSAHEELCPRYKWYPPNHFILTPG